MPATFINETMTASRSRCQVLILDCCHSGAFARGMVAKGGESVDIHDRFEGRGRVVLTASNATQYAFQGDEIIGAGGRSVFTHHLVRGLETGEADLDGDGWVSLDELYDYVYERVTDETPQQTPGKWTFDLQGDIRIARNPRWTVKPVELPSELLQAIESPFTRVREGAVYELNRLLQGSHLGLALAARAALARLAEDDSRRVSAAAIESLAREEAEAERLAAQKAETERAVRGRAEQERLARPQRGPVPRWAWAAGGMALVMLLIGLGGWAAGWWSEPTETPTRQAAVTPSPSTETPTEAPTPTLTPEPTVEPTPALGTTQTRPTDDMVMVYVPGGTFQMGSTDDEVDDALQLCNEYRDDCNRGWLEYEPPTHTVALDGFWIDQTEVTNAQYRQCVEAGSCDPPSDSSSYTRGSYYDNSSYDDYPVIYVSWHQAQSYCEWAEARLPTEAEWEYAARGSERRVFPWGDEFDGTRLNYCDSQCQVVGRADKAVDDGHADTAPVGSFPRGISWCGALDMAGNVWEWVANWYGSYPSEAQANPTGPETGGSKMRRGGSWDKDPNGVRSAYRYWGDPDSQGDYLGFRCARGSE